MNIASAQSHLFLDSEPTPERILEIGMGFWASKTLLSAVELGVFTALAEGPRSYRHSGFPSGTWSDS